MKDKRNAGNGPEDTRQGHGSWAGAEGDGKAHDAAAYGEVTEEELLMELRAGLDLLDRMVPVIEPDPLWMEAQMEANRQRLRRVFIWDLMLFLLTALTVLFVMGAVLYKLPAVFFALQAVVLVLAPVILLRRERKKVQGS
ncbi:YxlC family protein [Gorillibacterium sp. sgz5001074]|uniref:YxlC family protein n=1 Tax=Gorillibacterium sp. sgz5001074 TaxID=3446695 RepID=UPI003F66B83A